MKEHVIKKAVIPLAGYGTRMYPLTKCIKKAFMPVYGTNTMEPLIINLLLELYESGIEEIALVITKDEEEIYRNIIEKCDSKVYNKLSKKQQDYENRIEEISKKITYIIQEEALGFGHAIYLTKKFSNNEPVLVLLGDTVYKSNTKDSCTSQLLKSYDTFKMPMLSLKEIPINEVKYYGVSKGVLNKNILDIETIIEKPSIELTQKELLVDGKIYGNFGQFVVNNEVYKILEEMINNNITPNGEVGLTESYTILTKEHNIKGVVIDGNSYDLGNINSYQKYLKEYGRE